MNYFIKINESVFEISKTFADLLEKDFIAVSQEIQDKKHTYILNDTTLSSFQVVNSTSQTHFYIKIRNSAKLRVNKLFFEFLAPRSKQGLPDVEKTHNANTTKSSQKPFPLETIFSRGVYIYTYMYTIEVILAQS